MHTASDPTHANFVAKDILYQEIPVPNIPNLLIVLKPTVLHVMTMEHVRPVLQAISFITESVYVTSKTA